VSVNVDLLVSARRIYSVDEGFSFAECMAIRDGHIVAIGRRNDIEASYQARQKRDFGQAFIYPGFIDPHCHFLSFGYVLQRADLFGSKSWEEAVERLADHAARRDDYWVQGRGWDQNEWSPREFPTKDLLDRAFPSNPVFAIRVDGHAAMANTKALSLAGIDEGTVVDGGIIAKSDDGSLTGLLLDNAVSLVKNAIPVPDDATKRQALEVAQSRCFAVGLTSVSNAGTELDDLLLMDKMQDGGGLGIRIYAMLAASQANIERIASRGPLLKDRLTARSFKMYADGALGSRGAYLLEPYADDPTNRGLLTLNPKELERVCGIASENGFQMNVHAIGDAAVRLVLDVYEKFLSPGNDQRWRIEHAQIIHPDDLRRFGELAVIPSVQTTHATSDMGWTENRLGPSRMGRAHIYRQLLEQNGWLANGSDFPIEKIEPLRGFRSAVFRKDDAGLPEGGFHVENSLTREQALRAMTIWAARANSEEADKGSLEVGKWADFTVLDTDLMTSGEDALWKAKVLATGVAGSILFDRGRE